MRWRIATVAGVPFDDTGFYDGMGGDLPHRNERTSRAGRYNCHGLGDFRGFPGEGGGGFYMMLVNKVTVVRD